MNLPSVKNTLNDPNSGVTYHVMAYRQTTPDELLSAVRHFLASEKPKLKVGKTFTIWTTIGASG